MSDDSPGIGVNVYISEQYAELKSHLMQFPGRGKSRADRLKLLAYTGLQLGHSVCPDAADAQAKQEKRSEEKWNGRVNLVITDAYKELKQDLEQVRKGRAERIRMLAHIGLLALQGRLSPTVTPRKSATLQVEKPAEEQAAAAKPVAAEVFGDSLFQEDAVWG